MFEFKFHQQAKFLWGRIKFSKINLVLPLWVSFFLSPIIFLPNFVAFNYQKVITNMWIIFASFYIALPLIWILDPCPPKILDAHLIWFIGLSKNVHSEHVISMSFECLNFFDVQNLFFMKIITVAHNCLDSNKKDTF